MLHKCFKISIGKMENNQEPAASFSATTTTNIPATPYSATSHIPATTARLQKRDVDSDEEDEETTKGGSKAGGRRKIQIEYIQVKQTLFLLIKKDKSRRHITFSKRKAGIMKKAYELSTLTG